jgi:hypothetical protein
VDVESDARYIGRIKKRLRSLVLEITEIQIKPEKSQEDARRIREIKREIGAIKEEIRKRTSHEIDMYL